MKQKILLVLSVAAGLLAMFLTQQYLAANNRKVERRLAEIDRRYAKIGVLAAGRDLPAGSILQRSDLKVLDVVASGVRGHAVPEQDVQLVIGRKTIAPLQTASPIYWSDLEGGDPARRGLAGDITHRMRALSINVSGAAAVSGMVRPNNRVDVIGTFTFPSRTAPGEMELVTMTILQDVTVLACGRETAKSQVGSARSGESAAGGSYGTVTLEVTPREAEMLVFAEQIKGRLALALRNPDDVDYEKELPRVNYEKIEEEIERLNEHRQRVLRNKRDR
ncbi:MAG: Flp pilus assembly protein CpaB [Kiritimatiellia bacterium]|jgi:pilus assembly protein CpaB